MNGVGGMDTPGSDTHDRVGEKSDGTGFNCVIVSIENENGDWQGEREWEKVENELASEDGRGKLGREEVV